MKELQKGFSIIEVIIASAVFVTFASGAVVAIISAINTNRLGAEQTIANQYTSEGLDAVRSIKNQAWTTLISKTDTGNTGITNGSGVWAFNGTSNTLASDNRFTRTIAITTAQRDSSGNITTGISPVGLNTKGSNLDNGDANAINGSKYTTGATAGSITSMSVYVGPPVASSPNNQFQLAIYTDNSGNPGNFIAQSTTGTLTANGWNTVSISAYLDPNTSYWFFYNTNGLTTSDNNVYYNPVGSGFYQAGVSFGTWQTTITVSNGTTASVTFSIYATFGDPNTRKVTSTTTWNFNSARQNSVVLSEYMTNWKLKKGGMLAYADTTTGANAILTKTFNATTNIWSSTSTLFPDGSSSSSNALEIMHMYSSNMRNEKIIVSRHSNSSTTQTNIYASVWNGSTWTKQTLATWSATSANDFLNFDGTYLNNGDFMVVYSDNTTTPKFRIWNGSAWSAQLSVGSSTLTGVPNWIVLGQRPGTNQVMAAFLTASSNTQTYYYNGNATYAAANWGVFTTHSTLTPSTAKRIIDFAFSPNTTTTGALIYATSTTAKNLTVRMFVASGADGSGTGTWGTATNAGTAQTNNLGAMGIKARPTAAEFHACNKDGASTPTIVCYKIIFSGSVPTIAAPVTVASATDTGTQKSSDISWKNITGDILLNVYSDNTTIPKFKKFTANSATWDSSATSITTTGSPGVFKTVHIISQDQGDDMLILFADANLSLYSIFWQGSGNAMYTTPAAKAYTAHGTHGVATANFWYDFAWDKF